MASVTQPPPPLQNAINTAAATYGVPSDLLAGIWRIESGGRYPNPAVNSKGYGGLFGTTQPYAPTQVQADLAASILRNGLVQSHGNVAEALSFYNSGKLQGGYTSVPGETTFGTLALLPTKAGPNPNASGIAAAFGPGTVGAPVGSAVSSATSAVESVGSFLGKITSLAFLLRAGEVVGGAVLSFAGLFLLAKQVGLASTPPPAAVAPVTRTVPQSLRAEA